MGKEEGVGPPSRRRTRRRRRGRRMREGVIAPTAFLRRAFRRCCTPSVTSAAAAQHGGVLVPCRTPTSNCPATSSSSTGKNDDDSPNLTAVRRWRKHAWSPHRVPELLERQQLVARADARANAHEVAQFAPRVDVGAARGPGCSVSDDDGGCHSADNDRRNTTGRRTCATLL